MTIELGRLEHVPPRELWTSESAHFTPWLAANLDLLSEALGIDLELTQTEAGVGAFACDIAARDTGRDRVAIIENQLEPTDHRHLGQILTYAAGLDAAVIVWISPEVREEHREAIDWLNRVTSEKIEFFAVALELVRIGASKPAVVFRLAASPNAWAKTAAAASRPDVSSKAVSYQQFFQPVMDELREKHAFTNARAAQPQSWYAFTSGVRGFTYNMAFAAGRRLRAELYVDMGDAARNKAAYDYLEVAKADIEAAIGAPLEWERLDQKRACRISLVYPNIGIEDAAERGDFMRGWIIEALLKMKAAFGHRLAAAAQAFAPG